jgi:hypothetical protein
LPIATVSAAKTGGAAASVSAINAASAMTRNARNESRGKENTGAIEHVHFLERFQEDTNGRHTHCHCICGVTIPCERPSGCPHVDNAPPRR